MWRSGLKLALTGLAMLFTFLGLRDVTLDWFTALHEGWVEIAAYFISVCYGLMLHNWLSRLIGPRSQGDA